MDTFHRPSRSRAFSFIELLVILGVLALLAALLLPALANSKQKAQRAACISNLKQVGISFRTWAGDYNDRYPMRVSTNAGGAMQFVAAGIPFPVFQVMSNEVNNPRILVCPSDIRQGVWDFKTLKNENLSYFVGVDADETMPAMLLSGDRNLMVNGEPPQTGMVSIKTADNISWSGAMHRNVGNIGLADGSVQAGGPESAQQLMRFSGTNINRLVFP